MRAITVGLLLFTVATSFMLISAQRGLYCYQQQPGWRFWDLGECANWNTICVRVKNCRQSVPLTMEGGLVHKEMEMGDEVRGCVHYDFCENLQMVADCDCKPCATDMCNSALGSGRKMPFVGGPIMALCLAIATAIWGIVGHLMPNGRIDNPN